MLPPSLGDLVDRLVQSGRDVLAAELRFYALVGAALGVEEDEWNFRTGGALVVRSATSEDTVVDPSYHVHLVRKVQAGPFSDTVLVGRSHTNDIVLPDTSVSKLHARIRADGGTLGVFDAGSSNGTFIGKERLVPDRPYPIKPGDHLMLGECVFQLFAPATLVDVVDQMARS